MQNVTTKEYIPTAGWMVIDEEKTRTNKPTRKQILTLAQY